MIINKYNEFNKYNELNNYFITIILALAVVWIIYYFTPYNYFVFYNKKKD
jgi:hypothetical protein